MKNILYFLFFITVSYKATAQITYIPDPLFEQELITQNIDSDGIVNGQILTSDALAVTSLTLYYVGSGTGQYIEDLTGIEDFINLESLIVNGTMVEELNVSTLVNLKYLDCVDNMLTSVDVSNNILLEYLDVSSGGDVYPMNHFTEIDLSNNPNIDTLHAVGGITKINLNNGNNNPNMFINIIATYQDTDPDEIYGHTCIEVDDVELAQNNQYPYSEWTVYHAYMTYSYTDDVEECSLSTQSFTQNKINIYPNPVSDMLYFETVDTVIEKVIIFDLSGRKVLEQNEVNTISVSHLQKGSYLIKIFSDKGVQAKKIIVK
ncbi:MAG: T9SS type A sorting domain-containing protein [Flavobacteriaceae bacterium]